MPNLNIVQLMGNLTRDPEVKFTPRGTAVAQFGLAINRVWYDEQKNKKEEVLFVDVEFWGAQAEILQKYVHKGDPIYVQGRLKLDQWDDKQSGQKRSKLRVVGESFQFLKGKDPNAPSGGYQPKDEDGPPQHRGHGSAPTPPLAASDRPLDEEDDDIPFRSILSLAIAWQRSALLYLWRQLVFFYRLFFPHKKAEGIGRHYYVFKRAFLPYHPNRKMAVLFKRAQSA